MQSILDTRPIFSPRATVELYGIDPDLPPGFLNFDRVLMLDLDGCLHPESCGQDLYFCFSPEFCDVMRSADPKGEVPIVISSDWRLTETIASIRGNFPDDLARQIVGVTDDLLDKPGASQGAWAMRGGQPSREGSRQREVLAWMRTYAPASQWLAIDDRPSLFADGCENLFTVPGLQAGNGGGINGMVADDLLVRLKVFLA